MKATVLKTSHAMRPALGASGLRERDAKMWDLEHEHVPRLEPHVFEGSWRVRAVPLDSHDRREVPGEGEARFACQWHEWRGQCQTRMQHRSITAHLVRNSDSLAVLPTRELPTGTAARMTRRPRCFAASPPLFTSSTAMSPAPTRKKETFANQGSKEWRTRGPLVTWDEKLQSGEGHAASAVGSVTSLPARCGRRVVASLTVADLGHS